MNTIKLILIIAISAVFFSCGSKEEAPKYENQSNTQNVQPNTQSNTSKDIGKRWWIGRYTFDESAKNVSGEGSQSWSYILDVKALDDENLVASLQVDGFQTMTRLEAKVNATGMDIEFIFDKYGKDNMFEKYKKGDRLFAMMRNTDNVVMTNWDKLMPNVVTNQESGKVMFKKIAS